jgi:hypothetical protein|tara:strand:+ start:225 stop:374 length:150 start_codon:yes stop_codon:yes gene_type:complete
MQDELRTNIEAFIISYENQINDIDNMDMRTTEIFLEGAINLLTEVVKEK